MRFTAIVITLAATAGGCGPSALSADPDARSQANPDAGPDALVWIDTAVYAHSGESLFRLDATTLELTEVGDFDNGCRPVWDIALDKDSNLYGSGPTGIYRIDRTTAACSSLVDMPGGPNSLSFVPEGTLEPDREVLVAYNGATWTRIDLETGTATSLGALETGYFSSGDVVSVKDGGTYLTAAGWDCADCLFEVSPITGTMIKNWGPLGYGSVYGLAYWGGTAYGFSALGGAFAIHFGTDTVTTTPISLSGPMVSFFGAGSSTSAPIVVE